MLEVPAHFSVRCSPRHGRGIFTTCCIPAGTRVLEYTGDRISHTEASARYDDGRDEHAHTLLFTVDRSTVIDGNADDNFARYVNHSCDPNCGTFLEDGRIFIETVREVPAGDELTYDYRLRRPQPLPRDWRRRYACRCGSERCRGTMLVRPPRPVRAHPARPARRARRAKRARA